MSWIITKDYLMSKDDDEKRHALSTMTTTERALVALD
jgi:hypothetical protein